MLSFCATAPPKQQLRTYSPSVSHARPLSVIRLPFNDRTTCRSFISSSPDVRPSMTTRDSSLVVSDTSGIRRLPNESVSGGSSVDRSTCSFRHWTMRPTPQCDDASPVYYGACGCHQGRAAGFATLAIFVLLVLTGVISIRALGIGRAVLVYFAISFVSMFFAKIVALRRARRFLHQLANELDSSLHATEVAHG